MTEQIRENNQQPCYWLSLLFKMRSMSKGYQRAQKREMRAEFSY